MYVKMSTFLVVGLQKSGLSISKLLLSKNAEVFIYDDGKSESVKKNIQELKLLGAIHTENYEETLLKTDILVLSPGVPIDHAIPVKARELGIRIIGELELSSYFLKSVSVAVTGTNGKTTTCSLINHILNNANVSSVMAGNSGTPLSSVVNELNEDTTVVLEVSSFQLETVSRFAPHIACVLNITPDHLERHYNMSNYEFLKSKIVRNLKESEFQVLNYEDSVVRSFSELSKAKTVYFSKNQKVNGAYRENGNLYFNEEFIVNENELTLSGEHNLENILCSICVCKLLGLSSEEIENGLKTFKGVKHRLQNVKTLNGITFINDSKSTNPDSLLKAVESMNNNFVLIIGGYDKGLNYQTVFKNIVKNKFLKQIVITGASANKMFNELEKLNYKNVSVECDFEMAIFVAYKTAKTGETVLFSPATSSFDLFSDFEERGDKFIETVNSF